MKISLFHTLCFVVNANTYIFSNRGELYITGTNGQEWKYRESVNPIFYLYFPNGIKHLKLSYNPSYRIGENSYTSARPLDDIIINGVIDYIEFYKKNKGFITIMATASSKYQNYNYSVVLDNNIIQVSYDKNISYLSREYVEAGSHRLSLMIHKDYKVSRGDGFINSYQIGVWDKPYINCEENIRTNASRNGVLEYTYTIQYMSNIYDDYEYNYNDLINSQPKSSQTHFHI